MTKKFFLRFCLILTFGSMATIVFTSCEKNCVNKEVEPIIFTYKCYSGWVGLDENLKITSDSTYYSFRHDLSGKNYKTSIKTSREQWNNLKKTFHFETFIKIQDESCGYVNDLPMTRFSVIINNEDYSFYNGECSIYYEEMQDFFDLIYEQIKLCKK